MQETLVLDTEERIKAFTHPYRLRLLSVLREAKRAMTATEAARLLGDGPGKAHYHMRLLESAGLVIVARTETVNGIVARYYEPAARYYSVAEAARGSVGGERSRDEVARMISRSFRDGLKAFLGGALRDEPDGPKAGEGAFLLDRTFSCSDERWLAFRDAVEALMAELSCEDEGTRPRRVFLAGMTAGLERRGQGAARGAADEGESRVERERSLKGDWKPHPEPAR